MRKVKGLILIVGLILSSMLVLPILAVNFVPDDAGMLVCLAMIFILNPIISVLIGIISAKDVKFYWFAPFLIAVFYWLSSTFTFKTAFPIVYSLAYFVICSVTIFLILVFKKK